MTMPNVRASAILARLRWVEEHHGREAKRALVVSLQPRHAKAITAAVSPSSWVPFDAFVALLEAIDRAYGAGDLALCRTLGKYAADMSLVKKASEAWSAHCDSGRAKTREMPNGVALVIEGLATPHRAHCLSVLGWLEQSATLGGVKVSAARETKCRTRGDTVCEFVVEYT